MKKVVLAALISVFFVSAPMAFAAGQGPDAGRPVAPGEVQKKLAQMGPVMGNMMEQMMAGMIDLLARPETADKLASFTRNYYDALVKKGFTKEEALRIVSSQQPMQGLMGK